MFFPLVSKEYSIDALSELRLFCFQSLGLEGISGGLIDAFVCCAENFGGIHDHSVAVATVVLGGVARWKRHS